GVIEALHRRKRSILLAGTTLIPLGLVAVNVLAAAFGWVPDWARTILGALFFWGIPAVVALAWLTFLFSLLASRYGRRVARWRRRWWPVGAWRSGPMPGAMHLLMEDDDQFMVSLERFLTEHQVRVALPLYDETGRYLFASPEKIKVLSRALVHASSH